MFAHVYQCIHQCIHHRESMVVPHPQPRQELQDLRAASSLQRRQEEETKAKMLQLQQEEVAKQDRIPCNQRFQPFFAGKSHMKIEVFSRENHP